MDYNPQKIEKKWQKIWEKVGIFRAKDFSEKKKFYILDMFPYPSAEGLHVGHLKGYTFSDVIAKKRLMEGYNVLHPMGWDAFGLPAENFALKTGIHPAISTKKAIKNIKRQILSAGFGYDWQREITTCQPNYYKWTQWMFLQFFKAGLVYRKEAAVNFCPSCKTVLAREQVIDGKCERCSSLVEKKYLEQWFFKITNYADRLLSDLDKIDWPEKIKIMQKNWIGKSEGTTLKFPILNSESIEVFTTRIDTLFGCTYIVIAPEHPIIKNWKPKIENFKEVEKYIENTKRKTEIERLAENKEKTGVEIKGMKAINPVNNREIPIFIADYVLLEYGTGAIMAVPAHDQRDFVFAQKNNLAIIEVIKPKIGISPFPKRAFEDDGILINSGPFSGLDSAQAKEEITRYLEKRNLAQKTIYYKLRDWLISRQRYWGAPIPLVFCENCRKKLMEFSSSQSLTSNNKEKFNKGELLNPGWISLSEKDLPVLLPKIKDFKPTGDGKSPLSKVKNFVETKCPKCGGLAKRETDTMDTFVCSSWYFLRYTDPKNKKEFASKKKIKIWLPVDLYIGGAEHAVMHLLYARFFIKALKDLKIIDFDEPFLRLFNQGTIYYKGAKMSKSKGNVINPDYIIKKFGADTMRLYEMFMGPAEQATEWSDKGVIGCFRFLNRVWNLQKKIKNQKPKAKGDLEKLLHKTIKKVSEDIESFRFNTAISSLMVLVNEMEKEEKISFYNYQILITLLAPLAPHIAEELYQKTKNKKERRIFKSIFKRPWPKYSSKLIEEETITLVIQVNGRVRDEISVPVDISEKEVRDLAISRENIKKWIEGKEIKKVIFIPKKLINIVV